MTREYDPYGPPCDHTETPLDVERLARALLLAVPGYQRWLAWPVDSHLEAQARQDAADAEVQVHARAIAAEYARLAESED